MNLETLFQNIANAIRSVSSKTRLIEANDFPYQIEKLRGGATGEGTFVSLSTADIRYTKPYLTVNLTDNEPTSYPNCKILEIQSLDEKYFFFLYYSPNIVHLASDGNGFKFNAGTFDIDRTKPLCLSIRVNSDISLSSYMNASLSRAYFV